PPPLNPSVPGMKALPSPPGGRGSIPSPPAGARSTQPPPAALAEALPKPPSSPPSGASPDADASGDAAFEAQTLKGPRAPGGPTLIVRQRQIRGGPTPSEPGSPPVDPLEDGSPTALLGSGAVAEVTTAPKVEVAEEEAELVIPVSDAEVARGHLARRA